MRRGRLGVGGALVLGLIVLGAAGLAVARSHQLRSALGLARPVAYANPVLDRDFPDPAVLKASDGFWYAYATQSLTDEGGRINIQVARSADLVHWEHVGEALPDKPDWGKREWDIWAPHVVEDGGRYVMYHSAAPDEGDGLCLAVATASSPAGPFHDKGRPLECGPSFVNIDPMAFDDPATGKHLLYWGSGLEPIKVRELSADRLDWAPGSEAVSLIEPNALYDYQGLVEGAWLHQRDGWNYLFFSGDNCCERKTHYAVMVARSHSLTGPFETLADATGADSSVILTTGGSWLSPGHNAIATDAAGRDWIVYHAIDPNRKLGPNDDLQRRLLIDPLEWVDGWPRVRDGHPSSGQQQGPAQP